MNSFAIYSIICIVNIFYSATNAEHNRLIRVDGINPTCYERPTCKSYEIESAVINVDKSIPYMGSSTCCFEIEADDDDKSNLMVKILQPTYLAGDDYIRVYRGKFGKLLANFTVSDSKLYREIFIDGPIVSIEFHKDKISKSVFDILVMSVRRPKNGKCDGDDFYCSTDGFCIDEDLICDRYTHCSDEKDEENCSYSVGNAPNFGDLKPTISIAIAILVAFLCLTLITLVICCLIRRKSIKKGCLSRKRRSTQPRTSSAIPDTSARMSINHTNRNIYNTEFQTNQNEVLNETRDKGTATTTTINETQDIQREPLVAKTIPNAPPPSYEEAIGKNI